ncbi:Protein phosphatase 2C 1 [Neolecta irregularis DAH-3]|uniref:Protein phosphatase 2C 1 n=1 Tax=Neolecta irregularis (strain DAH-3) TaxID=1198029 RepID=A0A1U7LTU7_NEOID|nr:Protein phosphatase 2C 1 [Neolecta irregularis DAH-3]|eukprot:OLL26003.1 Protein phosphatase 2C 1 [Neolecta irregularis DAH-3]
MASASTSDVQKSLSRRRSSLSAAISRMNPFSSSPDAKPREDSPAPRRSSKPKLKLSFPGPTTTFRVGVSEDTNKKCRRTMEDTHIYQYDYAGVDDQGFFGIFDGHAGREAADWCGQKFHILFKEFIQKNPEASITDLFDAAFNHTDKALESIPQKHCGCTAVTALVRWEQRDGSKSRMLYTANVGDARAVLSRGGQATRLSYDHKGSDENEMKRIAESGGLILNNRVLAVTRALGDAYMKDLITSRPFTTETVLDQDDNILVLACDGLWDVCTDQQAIDLIRDIKDPVVASEKLVAYALEQFTTDNLTCMVIHLNKEPDPSLHHAPAESSTLGEAGLPLPVDDGTRASSTAAIS